MNRYTEDDLMVVNTAIAKLMAGERVVQITKGDMTIEYGQTKLDELRALRGEIIDSIRSMKNPTNYFRMATSKGL